MHCEEVAYVGETLEVIETTRPVRGFRLSEESDPSPFAAWE
jgi:hypothetical protein